MPKPTNKINLIKIANDEFIKLCKILENTPKEILKNDFKGVLPNNTRDKNAKDVLAHLFEWQKMLENFILNNLDLNGAKIIENAIITPFLPSPYNFRTYPKLNIKLHKKHQNTSFEMIFDKLKTSHNRILQLVEKISEDDLFTKKRFKFTLTSNLAGYIISSTSSHYIWAIKQLKSGYKSKQI